MPCKIILSNMYLILPLLENKVFQCNLLNFKHSFTFLLGNTWHMLYLVNQVTVLYPCLPNFSIHKNHGGTMLKWTFCFLEGDFLKKLSERPILPLDQTLCKTLYADCDSSLYYVIKIFPISYESYFYRESGFIR